MWVIVLKNRSYCIGPFEWKLNAELYIRELGLVPSEYDIRELIAAPKKE
jgi:hypothetical protein